MNKPTKHKDAAYDAFPMNKKTSVGAVDSSSDALRAFGKVKALPEVDAFSKKSGQDSDRRSSSEYDAFSKKKKEDDDSSDFPMTKRSDRSRENRPPRENRNPHLVFEPMTYSAATIPSAPTLAPSRVLPAIVVVSGGDAKPQAQTQEDASFAAKFASKMKITTDPHYVPPPTIVNMESEQDFPTLGGPLAPLTSKASGWGQTAIVLPAEEKTMETPSPRQKRRKQAKTQSGAVAGAQKKVPVLPRHALGTKVEVTDEFKPIDYDEDAFDKDEELLSSDMDEEALFGDSNEEDDEDDELDPNIYENRRHPDEIY